MKQRILPGLGLVLAGIVLAGCSKSQAAGYISAIKAQEAGEIATDAYIYGYPLVTMEMTRRVMTNVAQGDGMHAPMGEFARVRTYPDASFHEVTAPNADTLYSVAWLELSRGPYIFSIPDSNGRYYLMPILDAFSNVFQVPGKRTTGTKAQMYAITGPGWKGSIPSGVTEYKSPTNLVWILGRTYCTGTPQDYKEAHAFQDGLTLVPLRSYGKTYTASPGVMNPNIDMHTPVREQVNRMDGAEYFVMMAELLKNNPPAAADARIVRRMARIGIVPGKDFDITKLEPAVAAAIAGVPKPALQKIAGNMRSLGATNAGWVVMKEGGVYGTDYLRRASVAFYGLGCNRPADAIYPTSDVDVDGAPYSGTNHYIMHFGRRELPPVNAFWSLTMYNGDFFFVDNSLDRYTLSQRDKLKYNDDGSVDLYLQAENPGPDKESNWLPAPKDKFVLMLRLYWPREGSPSILNGSWNPPGVGKMD